MAHEGSHRFYRYQHQGKTGWVSFQVRYRETDLWIRAQKNVEKEALHAVLNCRHQLEQYIFRSPLEKVFFLDHREKEKYANYSRL